jgi:signal transduction histidine kinase
LLDGGGGHRRGIVVDVGGSNAPVWRSGLRPVLPLLWLALVGAMVIAGLFVLAAQRQDRLAAERSAVLVGAVLLAEQEALASRAAALAADPRTAAAAPGIGDAEYPDRFIVDQQDRTLLAVRRGRATELDLVRRADHGLRRLVERARTPAAALPERGVVTIDGVPCLAAVRSIATEAAAVGGRVLVLAQPLDPPGLARLGDRHRLNGLALLAADASAAGPGLPLTAADGGRLGLLAWEVERPGRAIALEMMVPGGVAFVLLLLLGFILLRQIERARRASHRDLVLQAATMKAVADGIVAFDEDLRLITWNRTYVDMFALPPEMMRVGMPLAEILAFRARRGDYGPDPPDELIAARLAAVARSDYTPDELAAPGGRLVLLRRSPLPGGGYVSSFSDITALKQAEQALIAARDQAELANRTKSEFLANVSHELRTPLNAILGFSEIMLHEQLGPLGEPRYREFARDIHDSGAHLLAIINDILDLSRIEAGTFAIDDEVVRVDVLFAAVQRLMRERAAKGGVAITVEVPPGLPPVRADERALKQILLNLLSNAVKFTPAGGHVALQARLDPDGGMALSVRDTGIGMAAADLPKALASFAQVDSSLTRKYEGIGLGLPISRALAELHGGRLELASAPGAGTTATVRLPADRVIDRSDAA